MHHLFNNYELDESEVLKSLIKLGVDYNASYKTADSALIKISKNNGRDLVTFILKKFPYNIKHSDFEKLCEIYDDIPMLRTLFVSQQKCIERIKKSHEENLNRVKDDIVRFEKQISIFDEDLSNQKEYKHNVVIQEQESKYLYSDNESFDVVDDITGQVFGVLNFDN